MSEAPATYAAATRGFIDATGGLTDALGQITTDLRANNVHECAVKLNTLILALAGQSNRFTAPTIAPGLLAHEIALLVATLSRIAATLSQAAGIADEPLRRTLTIAATRFSDLAAQNSEQLARLIDASIRARKAGKGVRPK